MSHSHNADRQYSKVNLNFCLHKDFTKLVGTHLIRFEKFPVFPSHRWKDRVITFLVFLIARFLAYFNAKSTETEQVMKDGLVVFKYWADKTMTMKIETWNRNTNIDTPIIHTITQPTDTYIVTSWKRNIEYSSHLSITT